MKKEGYWLITKDRKRLGIIDFYNEHANDSSKYLILLQKKTCYNFYDGTYHVGEKYIKYSVTTSPNIIDLIEVGDYVNGEIVHEVMDNLVLVGEERIPIKQEDIKSLVTREQFEEMNRLSKKYIDILRYYEEKHNEALWNTK